MVTQWFVVEHDGNTIGTFLKETEAHTYAQQQSNRSYSPYGVGIADGNGVVDTVYWEGVRFDKIVFPATQPADGAQE